MFKNKSFIKYLVAYAIFVTVCSVTFSLGIFNNPNFSINDLCMNLATELLGILIALLVVDTYIRVKSRYLQERSRAKTKPTDFDISADLGVVKSVATLKDTKTGIEYILVIHENGSALTPRLEQKPDIQ